MKTTKDALDMPGRVPRERMVELRRGSILRQRLQMAVDEADQQIRAVDYDMRCRHQQLAHVKASEPDPEKRRRDVALLQSDIVRLEGQMTARQHRLAVALQDLHEFEDATAELNERSGREEGA